MMSEALRGHLDALILAVLETEPLHGYAVMEALQVSSGGALALPTGSLYPALRRLERAGLVESEWSTVSGRRRRTYQLTSAGRSALANERTKWRDFAAMVDGVLRPGSAPA
ncbi:PadR family transcriptional regulator [Streptomyces sp. NPDC004783]|uniref:PadR family transcriptional regulator n=1 Tax=unclassified Streptomyces TaxID=2593676 RepID=UPI0033BE4FA6